MESHQHHHHHHVHNHQIDSLNNVFKISIALNVLYVAIEAGVGFYAGSLGLLSDAGHNLGDVFSLLLALLAFRLAKVHPTARYTYGYKKSTILISLVNALILVAAVCLIVVESIHKFSHPAAVDGTVVSWTAAVGIVVNGLTAWLLMRQQKGDLNVRGAFLHMAADTLVSLGVVVSGLVIQQTGCVLVDPVVSLVISVVILISTWRLLKESVSLSLDGVPSSLSKGEVCDLLRKLPHIEDIHHVHIWAISTTEVALTAHIVLGNMEYMESVKDDVRRTLAAKGIAHCTLEMELSGCDCRCKDCE